jgi:ABC-type oligopeptide transport system substrate-binding subunit
MKKVKCFIAIAAFGVYLTACSGSRNSTNGMDTTYQGTTNPNTTNPDTTNPSTTNPSTLDTSQHR